MDGTPPQVSRHRRRLLVLVLCLAPLGLVAPSASSSAIEPPPVPLPIPLPPPLSQSAQTDSSSGTSQPAQSAAPATAKRFSVAATPSLRAAIAAQINRIRRGHGLRPLRVSSSLVRAGTAHAQALAAAGLFAHTWPNGRLFGSWIRDFYPSSRYRSWSAGENLLWSSPQLTATSVVTQWLASATHRHILLLPSWREVGVGTVRAVGAPGTYGGQDVDIAAAEFGTRTR